MSITLHPAGSWGTRFGPDAVEEEVAGAEGVGLGGGGGVEVHDGVVGGGGVGGPLGEPYAINADTGSGGLTRAAMADSTSWRFSSSLLMSTFHPSSLAARRTFWPFLPMASESCESSTITSMCFSSASTMVTRLIFAGLNACVANVTASSEYSMMLIFSPRSSRMMDCTRMPFMPTQAPTLSTSRSRLCTAILVRSPASRAHPLMVTVLS